MSKLSFSTQLSLLKLFLIEEYRRHIRYVSPVSFYLFPIYIALFTYIAVALNIDDALFSYGAFFYGIGVGAFGYLGIQYLRKRLREFLLVNLPEVLPLTFRLTFILLFLRDLIYYLALVGISVLTVLFLFSKIETITQVIVMFLLGYSASYGISMSYLRSRILAGILILPLIPTILLSFLEIVLKLILIVAYILLGVLITPHELRLYLHTERRKIKSINFKSRPLFVKTWIDVIRSGMPVKLIFGYFLPLILIVTFSNYLSGKFKFLNMNTIGYSSMIGFLTLVIYSWLATVDDHTYLSLLPTRPHQLIKSMFLVYTIITTIIVVPTTIAIGIIRGEYTYIPIALAVGMTTSVYGFWCMARLTGLNTTSMLFDPSVMIKFSAAVIPLNMLVLAHSMVLHIHFSIPMIIISIIAMLLITYSNIRKVEAHEDYES